MRCIPQNLSSSVTTGHFWSFDMRHSFRVFRVAYLRTLNKFNVLILSPIYALILTTYLPMVTLAASASISGHPWHYADPCFHRLYCHSVLF